MLTHIRQSLGQNISLRQPLRALFVRIVTHVVILVRKARDFSPKVLGSPDYAMWREVRPRRVFSERW